MVHHELKPGASLKGATYRIEKVLGQGSFGITYLATAKFTTQGNLGKIDIETKVAIKEFFMKEVNGRDESGSITGMSEGSLSYNYAQKFRKEAENLAGMSHPNIVKVIDFISANNTYYYVMDYIEGENLNEYLKHHRMTEQEAADTIVEVARALRYMHEEKHMLHLDLKPGNIMRRASDGHLFLIDFGLSKHYNEEGVPETSTNVGLGTPGYAPIEQANSKRAKQFRTTLDIYALGATYYKLLTGQTPPSADELVSDEDIVKEELLRRGISEKTVAVVVNAMKPNVKQRTQNVDGFLKALNSDDILADAETDEATVVSEERSHTDRQNAVDVKNAQSVQAENIIDDTVKHKDVPKPQPTKVIRKYLVSIAYAIATVGVFLIVLFYSKLREPELEKVVEKVVEEVPDSVLAADGTINGHEYVDLGLSVKWAMCNVDASSPSDYGSYFAWGETFTKAEYTEENSVTWEKSMGDISGDSRYDVARARWGGTWRLPTAAEIDELTSMCKRKWTTQGGHNGYLVTGPNGNSIFLPAAGWRNGSSLYDVGEDGNYWSSTPYGSNTQYACYLLFYSSDFGGNWDYHNRGHTVRPVSE